MENVNLSLAVKGEPFGSIASQRHQPQRGTEALVFEVFIWLACHFF
jgi:hypothetical protein